MIKYKRKDTNDELNKPGCCQNPLLTSVTSGNLTCHFVAGFFIHEWQTLPPGIMFTFFKPFPRFLYFYPGSEI
jgi:hypothetical protein